MGRNRARAQARRRYHPEERVDDCQCSLLKCFGGWADKMSVTAYSDELRCQAGRILADYPDIPREWHEAVLTFPAAAPDGFEVALRPCGDGVIVSCAAGYHEHVNGPPAAAVEEALGLARDLLSSDMRLRELRAGGRAYRWVVERRAADGWIPESEAGLLFWRYFARRDERIYQNRQLPGRFASADTEQGADR